MKRGVFARLDSPVACLVALAVVLSIFTFGKLSRSGDPSTFIVAGDRFSDVRAMPGGVVVLKDSAGYDGQFYYRLALTPFTSRATDAGVTLDNPAYRHQRILYPLIVHLVSLGEPRFVPVAMIATNFVFLCALAWIAGAYAQALRRHAAWGLLIVANPGFLITYSRDLVEIVEMTFLLGSALLIRRDRPVAATVALTFAILARETSLIVAIAAAIVFAIDRLRGRVDPPIRWYCFAVPIVVFVAWQWALYAVWGHVPVRAGNPVIGEFPLAALIAVVEGVVATPVLAHPETVVALGFVAICSACVLYHLTVTRAAMWETLCCLLYGALLTSVGTFVWVEDVGFLRVFTHFYVFGAIVVLASAANTVGVVFALAAATTWAFESFRFGSPAAVAGFVRRFLGLV